MSPMPFDVFLDLGFSDNLRHVLRVTADRDNVMALSAHDKNGKLSAQAWESLPETWPDGTLGIWLKECKPKRSRTMQAVDLVLNEGLSVYAAAKAVNVHQSAVHRAIQRRSDKNLCPCCRQVIRDGFDLKIPDQSSASS